MRHQRETLTWQIVAQIRSRSPLAVDFGIDIDVVGTMNGAGMQIHFIGRAELFAENENVGKFYVHELQCNEHQQMAYP